MVLRSAVETEAQMALETEYRLVPMWGFQSELV